MIIHTNIYYAVLPIRWRYMFFIDKQITEVFYGKSYIQIKAMVYCATHGSLEHKDFWTPIADESMIILMLLEGGRTILRYSAFDNFLAVKR